MSKGGEKRSLTVQEQRSALLAVAAENYRPRSLSSRASALRIVSEGASAPR